MHDQHDHWYDCSRGDKAAISSALARLDVSTSKDDVNLRAEMAYGMFDTRGKVSNTECMCLIDRRTCSYNSNCYNSQCSYAAIPVLSAHQGVACTGRCCGPC